MSDQAPQNKKVLASQQMRQTILRTTIEIIGSEGYVALTASRLSQRASISKGALYHHFANLDDVRMSALAYLMTLFIAAEPDNTASFSDYLNASGERLFNRMKQQPVAMKALYAYIFQALVDEPLKRQIKELMTQSLDEYTEVIGRYFPALSDKQRNQVVLILDAYFGGAVFQWFLLDDEAACLAGWRQFSSMLVSTLQAMERS